MLKNQYLGFLYPDENSTDIPLAWEEGRRIRVEFAPNPYRKFNHDEEGWIRLTDVTVKSFWRNYSHATTTNNTPTNAEYWLFGDLVISGQNEIG